MAPSVLPLGKIPLRLVLEILKKMNFQTVMNLRRTTRWLHNFSNDYCREINVYRSIEAVSVEIEENFEHKFPLRRWRAYKKPHIPFKISRELRVIPAKLKEFDLCYLRPERISLELSHHQGLLEKLKKCCALLKKINWFSVEITISKASFAVLDTLMECGVTKLKITSSEEFREPISNHPLLFTLQSLNVAFKGDYDLSFVLAPREEREMYIQCKEMTKKGMDTIKKLFKLMAQGKIGTRVFQLNCFFRMNRMNLDASFLIEGIKNLTLFWSLATHKQSTIAHKHLGYRNKTFLKRRYYTLPLPSEEIGGICVIEDGGDLVKFEIYEKVEDLTRELCCLS